MQRKKYTGTCKDDVLIPKKQPFYIKRPTIKPFVAFDVNIKNTQGVYQVTCIVFSSWLVGCILFSVAILTRQILRQTYRRCLRQGLLRDNRIMDD